MVVIPSRVVRVDVRVDVRIDRTDHTQRVRVAPSSVAAMMTSPRCDGAFERIVIGGDVILVDTTAADAIVAHAHRRGETIADVIVASERGDR